jgi:hypothetical protein
LPRLIIRALDHTAHGALGTGSDEVKVSGWVGGVVPLVEVALDVGWEGAVQGDDLVAERAGGVGVGDGVGVGAGAAEAEEVEDAHLDGGLISYGTGFNLRCEWR